MPAKRESILVVDSNDASRRALCELLRLAGYEVAESASQTEGFDFVRNTGVDLLLLTADLADIQCCDALAEVKGNASTAGTRVILITQGGGAERARGLDLRPAARLGLPLTPRVRASLSAHPACSCAKNTPSINSPRKLVLPIRDERWRRPRSRRWPSPKK